MNAATLVTSLRLLLSPLFFLLFSSTLRGGRAPTAAIVLFWILFALIEATDVIDGFIARKTGTTTDLGKILDPFADSVARLSYFLSFLVTGLMPAWVFLLILYRDLGVSFIRLLSMNKGVILAAQLSGKIKAFIYAFACAAGLLQVTVRSSADARTALLGPVEAATTAFWWLAAAAAVWTLVDYAGVYRRMSKSR
jgi:CDP-diacylglycerol--glycerol-3-phosphate 3-phosphatidyltransferase